MYFDALKNNVKQMKEIARELFIFSNQLDHITSTEFNGVYNGDNREKVLLINILNSLTNQLKILNDSIPHFIADLDNNFKIGAEPAQKKKKAPLTTVQYSSIEPSHEKEKVSIVISEDDKNEFLKNLSMSNLTISELKKKYTVSKPDIGTIRKSNKYAKISNMFFKNMSNRFIENGYFGNLNRNLRKINSGFVLGTYLSMLFFTVLLTFIASIFLLIFLMFFDVFFIFPFISFAEKSVLTKFLTYFWIVFVAPAVAGFLFYYYPMTESKNVGNRINQELPFVTIHMSVIASSGVNPVNIFDIIVKGGEYRYSNIVFKKILNLINFHGEDIVTALRKAANSSPSPRLGELLNGLSASIKSGGDLHRFLNKHAENMLFDYKLERERYTRISETFMDVYISVAIAAPLIFLMIFIIIGSTGLGGGIFDLGFGLLTFLLLLTIVFLNLVFLLVLKLKQPPM